MNIAETVIDTTIRNTIPDILLRVFGFRPVSSKLEVERDVDKIMLLAAS